MEFDDENIIIDVVDERQLSDSISLIKFTLVSKIFSLIAPSNNNIHHISSISYFIWNDSLKMQPNLVKMQSKYSQNSVKMQSKCDQNVVKMRSKCGQNAVKILQLKCGQSTAKMRSKYNQNAAKMQSKCSKIAAKMQSNYSQNAVKNQSLGVLIDWKVFKSYIFVIDLIKTRSLVIL